ncbi:MULTISPECIES: SDR family oxidoreductase [Idiomarina]|jgi:NADP-dependent 3-hydroxy acid dehydrogenase YdfG|uniref:SDR family oxidoreductase n=1 Tax=Idiomarina abyssalis TaxID=86102 RepID=A0A8I1KEV7_9GAMM|nr:MULTISPECIES: SDR family oxidoreductase [Idiomarina]RDX34737.1 SDR family oxidoreductase [Idiomarina sp. HD9-110m-PIT-SAG05]HIC72931.1 SDR family oxidoreductase [Alphaproteobacteria bacterium]KPD21897.1 short-chain dehydrogenase [Idiomarina abyssalis]MAB21554.1 NAD(P)-dependent oxidoreductase [Idiomarina sp.]MAL83020.1 NAD(P)-dependent oxidoreductase [Idiomarina sp.]|tara:strand:+ start:1181 stop:1855 length:675 start_codon:yes stop_codon:yes gene_type:complete
MSKVLLITGASSGIGEATARKAAKEGLKLILTARRKDKLDALVEEFGSDNAIGVAADAGNFDELEQAVKQGVDKFGQLDAVFANAGTGVSTPGTEEGDAEEWKQMVDVNINGLLYTAKLTLPHLRKTTGHFLMTGSAAGRITLKGSVYGATKWFVHGFAQNLAEEMKEWNGRCTTIAPGMVNTPFFDEPKPDKLDPDDVADAVLYAINANPRNCVREVFLMPAY